MKGRRVTASLHWCSFQTAGVWMPAHCGSVFTTMRAWAPTPRMACLIAVVDVPGASDGKRAPGGLGPASTNSCGGGPVAQQRGIGWGPCGNRNGQEGAGSSSGNPPFFASTVPRQRLSPAPPEFFAVFYIYDGPVRIPTLVVFGSNFLDGDHQASDHRRTTPDLKTFQSTNSYLPTTLPATGEECTNAMGRRSALVPPEHNRVCVPRSTPEVPRPESRSENTETVANPGYSRESSISRPTFAINGDKNTAVVDRDGFRFTGFKGYDQQGPQPPPAGGPIADHIYRSTTCSGGTNATRRRPVDNSLPKVTG